MDSKIKIIEALIAEGEQFTFDNFCYPSDTFPGEFGGNDKSEWLQWKTRVLHVVSNIMEQDSPSVQLASVGKKTSTAGYRLESFDKAKTSLIHALKGTLSALTQDVYGELKTNTSVNESPALSNKVFIVHGHDNELKHDVERFIHEIGLEPVVLHRQIDGGNTVIEKIEQNSDVGYAFVLLTPDEVAYTKDQIDIDDVNREIEFRARPNVIFEFGYFVGKLGRDKVCCLHKGDVVIPSDLSGLVYKKIDTSIDSQAYSIIRELKAAGYQLTM